MRISKFFNIFSLALLLALIAYKSEATVYYTYTNGGSIGNWHDAATWTTDPSGGTLTGSAIPGNNDAVIILNGYAVNLTANVVSTGLAITINNGGVLDLNSFQFNAAVSTLSGSGTLRIGSGYFPSVASNSFCNSSVALVEFDDFSGALPVINALPNVHVVNTTTNNHTVTFTNTSSYNLHINGSFETRSTSTGSLTVTFGSQTGNAINAVLRGSMTIGADTKIGVGAFNSSHRLTIFGNVLNNGTIDFSNNTQYSSGTGGLMNLTFSGATNNTLVCNGPTDLNTLTVDKGSGSDNVLHVTSSDPDYFSLFSHQQLLILEAGTLRLGANIELSRINGGDNFNLGSETTSPMLWIDGANVDANSAALVVYGKFRITAGSFTSVGREGGVIREEGQYIIEGGTVTLEKFRPSNTASTHRGSFVMRGGTFNATGTASNDVYARFSHPYPEQVFIMSGGTINVSNPESSGGGNRGGIHIGVKPSNFSVTGGTFNAILSGTADSYSISSTAPFYNLNISKTEGSLTTVNLAGIGSLSGSVTTAQPLTVLNNFTIDGTNNPRFNPGGLDVNIKGNFVIQNGATYLSGSNNTIFSGTGDQVFSSSVSVPTAMQQLTVDKPSGTLTFSGTTPFHEVNALNLVDGVLNDGGKTLNVSGTIFNGAIHSGTGSITLKGTATQTLTGDGSGIFGNLALDNASSPGAILTCNQTVSGTLTLAGNSNSILDIDIYQLSLTSTSPGSLTTTGNGFSASKMIRTTGRQSDGGIRKTFGNLSAFTFACGTPAAYAPVTMQFNAAPATYGDITIRPVASRHQFVFEGNTNNLQFYWKVTSSGISGIAANGISSTFQYTDPLVAPSGDDQNYVPARFHSTAWTVINATNQVDENSNLIRFSDVGYIDGDYTAGVFPAFGVVKIFYSKRNGNWNNTTPGATPWSNISHTGPDATAVPGPNDQVFIGDGAANNHTISVTTNGQNAGSLVISGGSVLDVTTTTGHNFGALPNTQVLGSGRLRISSASSKAEFPAGDFGNFIRTSGGTVEYYSTGSQNFAIPELSASPANLPLITYRHLVLTPAPGRYIQMPNQDETIYGNLTIQGQSATAAAHLNSLSAKTLNVNGNLIVAGGRLEYRNNAPQTVNAAGDISIATGAAFSVAGSGTTANNILNIGGNLVNNGVFDMAHSGSLFCNVIFTGSQNASITGMGSNTDFNILTVSKGNSYNSILEVNATSFSLSGSPTPLAIEYGTFRLSSGQSVTISNGVDFTIPASGRLSANGGTLRLSGPDGVDLHLNGILEILDGAVYVGTTANDNSIEYASTGTPTIAISGGNLYVQSQIRRPTTSAQGALTYVQSGNSQVFVALASPPSTIRGVVEILNSGSSFSMSGGTLSIVQSNNSSTIADLYLYPTSHNISGGTVEIGTGRSSQTLDINTLAPLYNLSVAGTTNTARLEINPLTLRGSLLIEPECTFNANALNLNIAGSFINLNTDSATGLTVGGFRAGAATQTTTFNGSGNHQAIAGVAGNLSNFANLIINNSYANGKVTLQANSSIRINNTLTLLNGNLGDGGNTITAIATVYNAATHSSTGAGQLLLAGSSTQVLTGNGSGKYGNLTLANNAGVTMNAAHEITGILHFQNGSLRINSHRLYLSHPGFSSIVGANASRYIISSGQNSDGGVSKAFDGSTASGTFVYPIGVAGKFTPATYTIATGASGGNINIVPVNGKHPSATGPGFSYLDYYWNVSNNAVDLLSLSHRYTYAAADIMGNESEYRDARYTVGEWEVGSTTGNPDVALNSILFTNTNLNGGYTTGEPSAFVNSIIYRSIASGSWESDLSVWDVDPPGTNVGPPSGSIVIIEEGHIVTINNNSKNVSSLEVRGRLHLGPTTGHNFGAIAASGAGEKLIQLQSSTFPGGNFTAFVASEGGTIEYNGAVNLPVQATYNHLKFTGTGTKSLANVDLTLNGSFIIEQGTVSNTAGNRNITLANSTADFVNNATFNAGNGGLVVGRNLINAAGGVFNAGNGSGGVLVSGNFTNAAGAVYNGGAGNLMVDGNFVNAGNFVGNSGEIHVDGNFSNLSGIYTGGTGEVQIAGDLTNNASFYAGDGQITIQNNFINSGASAGFDNEAGILTVVGDIANSANWAGGSGSVRLFGDWNNSGSFSPHTSTVDFRGHDDQSLAGNTTFYNLIRSGGGRLILATHMVVNNLLTLTSGKIVTGPWNIRLRNTDTQPVVGFSSANFIDGNIAIDFPNDGGSTRVFPVGEGNIYRPVSILQNDASSNALVRVAMINTAPAGSHESTLSDLSGARYYKVDLLSGTMNSPVIELSFNTNGSADEPVTTPGNLKVARATSPISLWTDEGGAGVFSPAAPAGYVTSLPTSIEFSTYFAIAYTDLPLPISLLSFTGTLAENKVHLRWTTASETGNDFFTIERSSDGKNFETILDIDGAGDSQALLSYSAEDRSPLVGKSYYRLKQTDFDGAYTYSQIITIMNEGRLRFAVAPNPLSGNTLKVLVQGAMQGQQYQLLLYDIKGKKIIAEEISAGSAYEYFEFVPQSALPGGVYLVKIISGVETITEKVIVDL